ncbi:MAG: DUF4271 domain-containing protein [Bacteroidales bacterium]|nr:DUF4271 domain-containing protein [Bacteroidales bacterium]
MISKTYIIRIIQDSTSQAEASISVSSGSTGNDTVSEVAIPSATRSKPLIPAYQKPNAQSSVQVSSARVANDEGLTRNLSVDNGKQEMDSDALILSNIHFDPINLYHHGHKEVDYKPYPGWEGMHAVLPDDNLSFQQRVNTKNQFNWTLVIGLLSLMILLFLKIYYQKFVTRVINTLVNSQLADTMFREKNTVIRRAFFMMNLNYILTFSLFILLISQTYGLSFYNHTYQDYLFILGIVLGILLARYLIYYGIGFIFDWTNAVNAQLHTYYLLNKNLGLFLLPLVFISIYTNPFYSKIMLFIGIGMFVLSTIFRIIRGFQIIIKNGVLIFYAILYLCTLELLPIVIGSRIIILLR